MRTKGRPPEAFVELTPEQARELQNLARTAPVGRVSERAHFILLSGQGKTVPEIAGLLGYTAQAVYQWLERYRRRGIEGLFDRPRTGRPPKERLLPNMVAAQACMSPPCYGHNQGCWTLSLMVRHLAVRFQVFVSQRMVRRALAAAEFVWGRGKLCLPKGRDPRAAEKMAYLQQALADPEGVKIAVDECDMHLLPVLRATWHPKGRQPEIPTPGQNKKRGIFGGVNLCTGEWLYHLTDRKRSVEFIEFLGDILLKNPVGTIYVLLDNTSIHKSKATLRWVAEHERIRLVFLPAYSGHDYNPAEKVWWYLKGKVAANRCFKTLAELDAAIIRHFRELTPGAILRLINSMVVRLAQDAAAASSSKHLCQAT